MSPSLTSNIILTLQQLPGIGNKTIFKIAQSVTHPISTIEQLCDFWASMLGKAPLKGKKIEGVTDNDLKMAYWNAQQLISKCNEEEVGIITFFDPQYPEVLKACCDEKGNADAPLLLYYRGDLKALKKPGIAIIGTREPTLNGEKAGHFFAGEFAKRGFNIVSGLAKGCDTIAHRGALDVGGTTTAFLANGLDWSCIYPKENLELAKEIVTNGGLLLSEYPVGQNVDRYGLVARDRLQAGLSFGTIVIQTGEKGGTMHAVNSTLMSRKPLFAVEYKNPSDYTHDKVQGNAMLIKAKGAYPLRSSEIDKAVAIVEGKNHNHSQNYFQPSLFD